MKPAMERLADVYTEGLGQLHGMPELPRTHTWTSTEEWMGGPCAVPVHYRRPGTQLAITPSLHNYGRWRVTHTGCGAAIGDAMPLDEARELMAALDPDDVEAAVGGSADARDRVVAVLERF